MLRIASEPLCVPHCGCWQPGRLGNSLGLLLTHLPVSFAAPWAPHPLHVRTRALRSDGPSMSASACCHSRRSPPTWLLLRDRLAPCELHPSEWHAAAVERPRAQPAAQQRVLLHTATSASAPVPPSSPAAALFYATACAHVPRALVHVRRQAPVLIRGVVAQRPVVVLVLVTVVVVGWRAVVEHSRGLVFRRVGVVRTARAWALLPCRREPTPRVLACRGSGRTRCCIRRSIVRRRFALGGNVGQDVGPQDVQAAAAVPCVPVCGVVHLTCCGATLGYVGARIAGAYAAGVEKRTARGTPTLEELTWRHVILFATHLVKCRVARE